METKLDKFGRVVIPKVIRDQLGLKPGERLKIEENGNKIVLEPVREELPLRVKEDILVYSGKATGDLDKAVQEHRMERIRKLTRRKGK
jgi:AbrB family looped-hinge helix DNA binding protein